MAILPTNPTETDDELSSLWISACTDYADETGAVLDDEELRSLRGPEDLSRQLDNEKDNFEDFRAKRRPLLHAMQAVVAPFESWGDLITGAAAAAFPPASSIMGAMLMLIRGARRVSEAFDMITDLFRKIGHFALRLDSYKGVPLSEGMKAIIVKVLVNFLRVCTVSQKLLRKGSLKGRLTKWAKNAIAEDTEVSSLMGELEDLTSQEHMMVSAHGLKMTNQALKNTEELLEREDRRREQEKLEKVKAALQPVSASSQVFSYTNENRMPGSGSWIENRLQTWWQGTEPLLWLHGGPGVGKSHLASKIITSLGNGELSGTVPLVASFFFRNNDVDLQSINKALRTLAWQIATQSPSFATHTEEFCLREDPDNTYTLWSKLLIRHLAEKPSAETCFVIDGLDEAEPEEMEVLLGLLERKFSEDGTETRPPLRFVLLSRDSVRPVFEGHSLDWIPDIEVGNNENKDDLHKYVSQKLQTARLFRSVPELLEEVIQEISREAEGLWEWANLAIKGVLRCRTKEQIQKVIRSTPRGIAAMLNQELQRLNRELSISEGSPFGENSNGEDSPQVDQLNIILSFVTLAQKPLNLWQLDAILQVIFKEEILNLVDDIRNLYSSLFQIRSIDKVYYFENVVILRHSSFYEYFRTSQNSERIHVNLEQTEANFLYVILETFRRYETLDYDTLVLDKMHRCFEEMRHYAQSFLPWHLMRANPKSAGKRREGIAALFEDLFAQEKYARWLVLTTTAQKSLDDYIEYPSSTTSKIGHFWLSAENRITSNKRAELVLNWFSPEKKEIFENNSRSAEEASNACPFTVLFSFMVRIWLRLWLAPDETNNGDGWPAAIPRLLRLYKAMAAADKGPEEEDEVRRVLEKTSDWDLTEMPIIMEAAEFCKLEHNAIWHSRVGQALLLNGHYREASEIFLVVLKDDKDSDTLNEQHLSVIHRDLARAFTQMGRHEEALKHAELAEMTELPREDDLYQDRVHQLLNLAQVKYRANRKDSAIATANKAFEEFLANKNNGPFFPDFVSIFQIFLDFKQLQSLRSVLNHAAEHCEKSELQGPGYPFAEFLFNTFVSRHYHLYRVLQIALEEDDQYYLGHLAKLMTRIDAERNVIQQNWVSEPTYLKYLIATILFDKGQSDTGAQGLCQIIIDAGRDDDDIVWHTETRGHSLAYLVRLCLSDVDIPSCEALPIALDTAAEHSVACLVISSWLQSHGNLQNAKHALRGRVKTCVALLSDDHSTNDTDTFKALFEALLMDPDSEEDLTAALYCIKKDHERVIERHHKEASDTGRSEDINSTDGITMMYDLARCSICIQEMCDIYDWYCCRSCPFKICCRECSGKPGLVAENSGIFKCPGICEDEHDFFYTGGSLRQEERVPEGMVPASSYGDENAIWIEDWKDRLVKKWNTEDLTFEGGLSGWCMSVLPEPQATRWAKMFKV
jgi:tetratricopeptide (TPR) repeat protein